MIITKKNLNTCRNSESGVCPSYYCNYNSITNTGGSPCIIKYTTKDSDGNTILGPDVAFRFDKNGNIQCQNYTLNYNILTDWTCKSSEVPCTK